MNIFGNIECRTARGSERMPESILKCQGFPLVRVDRSKVQHLKAVHEITQNNTKVAVVLAVRPLRQQLPSTIGQELFGQ